MAKKGHRGRGFLKSLTSRLRVHLKLLLIVSSISCVILGAHGIYVYFSRLEVLLGADAEKLFLAWPMPGPFANAVEWSSRKGFQSWFIPAIVIGTGIALWILQRRLRLRRSVIRLPFPKFTGLLYNLSLLKERKRSRQLRFVNRYRKKHALPPLKAYYQLDRIAKSHSYYMARNQTCNHAGFDHRATRVRQLTGPGYVAENCFRYPAKRYNRRVANELVKGWMKSQGHRENLLNSKFCKIGIGVVTKKGYVYATQIFSG